VELLKTIPKDKQPPLDPADPVETSRPRPSTPQARSGIKTRASLVPIRIGVSRGDSVREDDEANTAGEGMRDFHPLI